MNQQLIKEKLWYISFSILSILHRILSVCLDGVIRADRKMSRLLLYRILKSPFKKLAGLISRNSKRLRIGLGVFLAIYYMILPSDLFRDPVSLVIVDKDGQLLGARIADDGQWRFPYNKDVPEKFAKALIAFEDKRFYKHWGVDPLALARAGWQNTRHLKKVSGGSTLSMQLIRLSRKGKSRNIFEKMIEAVLATRLEWRYSKKEILALYASNAPFGGNVVGLDAASWKYFGKAPASLTWAEASTLAVLPNSPALIHPGRNRDELLRKRNEVLDRLVEDKVIDQITGITSKLEPLPDKPQELPMLAPHLLDRVHTESENSKIKSKAVVKTTIDLQLQNKVTDILSRHQSILRQNDIHNIAALVLDVNTGKVLAYVGNAPGSGKEHGEQVDVITAARSTGSILKPILYASALNDGEITPDMLIPDIPIQYGVFTPKNFDQTYSGGVSARHALTRSLNAPFVWMLNKFGLQKFYEELHQYGITTMPQAANYYGLSLILGGAECTLWDICGIYASMARNLNLFSQMSSRYPMNSYYPPDFYQEKIHPKQDLRKGTNQTLISAASIWFAFNAMQELVRPEQEGYWQRFSSSQRIAWKTGTSFGFRDAWAIGLTSKYLVGVWVGNGSGEARPDLIGAVAAAPVMFDIFSVLPPSPWFSQPYDDMAKVPICKLSGYRAGEYCQEQDSAWIPKTTLRTSVCPYHQLLHLDLSGTARVTSDCESPGNMQHRPYFVLPPAMEHYYRNHHPEYIAPPPLRDDCKGQGSHRPEFEVIYPSPGARFHVPKGVFSEPGKVVFEARHRRAEQELFWDIDGTPLGKTKEFHQFSVSPAIGFHVLTVTDQSGASITVRFEVVKE